MKEVVGLFLPVDFFLALDFFEDLFFVVVVFLVPVLFEAVDRFLPVDFFFTDVVRAFERFFAASASEEPKATKHDMRMQII